MTVHSENSTYDVIMVGGRPSGATAAVRLAQGGARVLLLDRSTFPSLPAVSSPIIYPCTMALLDEIGAPEAEYAHNTPKIRKMVSETRDLFRASSEIAEDRGRNYAYALDRSRFDAALWNHAAKQPNVTAMQGFAVTDLLWDESDQRVIGVEGRPQGGAVQRFYADTVVGADGRFSLVARKVSAAEYEVDEARTTSLYYAYWKNVAPYDIDEPLMLAHGTQDGIGYLMMDSADGTMAVVCEGYADVIERYLSRAENAHDGYLKLLQNAPRIWERLQGAEMVTSVRGLKQTPNFYRQMWGSGWALIGDAAHHKDPLGGQGIYDAVFGAKAFSEAYLDYWRGKLTFNVAMSAYKERFETETLPVYYNTLAARQNFNSPNLLGQLMGRYAMENPEIMRMMARVPGRMGDPSQILTTEILLRTVVSGVVRDAGRFLTGQPSPAAVPPLPSQRERGISETSSYQTRLGCLGWLFAMPAILIFGMAGSLRRRKSF